MDLFSLLHRLPSTVIGFLAEPNGKVIAQNEASLMVVGNHVGQQLMDWDLISYEQLEQYEAIRGKFSYGEREYERLLLPFQLQPGKAADFSYYIFDVWLDVEDKSLFNMRLVIGDNDELIDLQIETVSENH
jgi:hypothetical protein